MSDLSPLSGEERKSNFGAVRSVDDPEADLDQKGRSNTDFSSPVIRGGLGIGKRRFWSCPKGLRQQTDALSSASGMRTRLNEAGT